MQLLVTGPRLTTTVLEGQESCQLLAQLCCFLAVPTHQSAVVHDVVGRHRHLHLCMTGKWSVYGYAKLHMFFRSPMTSLADTLAPEHDGEMECVVVYISLTRLMLCFIMAVFIIFMRFPDFG